MFSVEWICMLQRRWRLQVSVKKMFSKLISFCVDLAWHIHNDLIQVNDAPNTLIQETACDIHDTLPITAADAAATKTDEIASSPTGPSVIATIANAPTDYKYVNTTRGIKRICSYCAKELHQNLGFTCTCRWDTILAVKWVLWAFCLQKIAIL